MNSGERRKRKEQKRKHKKRKNAQKIRKRAMNKRKKYRLGNDVLTEREKKALNIKTHPLIVNDEERDEMDEPPPTEFMTG